MKRSHPYSLSIWVSVNPILLFIFFPQRPKSAFTSYILVLVQVLSKSAYIIYMEVKMNLTEIPFLKKIFPGLG